MENLADVIAIIVVFLGTYFEIKEDIIIWILLCIILSF